MSVQNEILTLYRDTIRPLYAFVARRVPRDRDLCEDLVQDTWARAAEVWLDEGIPREPLGWLKVTVRNLLADHFRRQPTLSLTEAPLAADASWETERAVAWIHFGLNRLTPLHAQLLEARHFDGRSLDQIGQAHGLSARAVEGRLRRAREALREVLEPHLRREDTENDR